MARRGSRRSGSDLRRRGPTRDPLPLVLVVCEGKVTEPEYIEGFRLAQGTVTVRVRVAAPGGDPLALVESAASMRDEAKTRARRSGDSNEAFDEVWCVFDMDSHERFVQAGRTAQAAGIRVAISNPCFELWLLLHFADHTAHLSADEARRRLLRNLPGYDKHLRYEDFHAGYGQAVKRASELEQRHATLGREGSNPSTGMHRLTERIREFGKEARL
jgi:hypothetical protein